MNGYRKINGCRAPACAPETPAPPPYRLSLPEEHPCYNCPIINLTGSKPYCFLPRCLRQELTGHKEVTT